jgi:hypothetical protein
VVTSDCVSMATLTSVRLGLEGWASSAVTLSVFPPVKEDGLGDRGLRVELPTKDSVALVQIRSASSSSSEARNRASIGSGARVSG